MMTEQIKRRLIHFYTHGNIVEDFVASRRKKARKLRGVIRACFYFECAAAAACVIVSIAMGAGASCAAVIIGALAACAAAFMALGGGTFVRTVLYILYLAYSVICFIAGAACKMPSFTLCGVIMLLAAAAALVGHFAAWCREYVLGFSPAGITVSDYTRLQPFSGNDPTPRAAPDAERTRPVLPPQPPKSEMKLLSEQLAEILNRKPPVPPASNISGEAVEPNEPNKTDAPYAGAEERSVPQNEPTDENAPINGGVKPELPESAQSAQPLPPNN